jgi:hypothetical protein
MALSVVAVGGVQRAPVVAAGGVGRVPVVAVRGVQRAGWLGSGGDTQARASGCHVQGHICRTLC